jgi:hypothetical protein
LKKGLPRLRGKPAKAILAPGIRAVGRPSPPPSERDGQLGLPGTLRTRLDTWGRGMGVGSGGYTLLLPRRQPVNVELLSSH